MGQAYLVLFFHINVLVIVLVWFKVCVLVFYRLGRSWLFIPVYRECQATSVDMTQVSFIVVSRHDIQCKKEEGDL